MVDPRQRKVLIKNIPYNLRPERRKYLRKEQDDSEERQRTDWIGFYNSITETESCDEREILLKKDGIVIFQFFLDRLDEKGNLAIDCLEDRTTEAENAIKELKFKYARINFDLPNKHERERDDRDLIRATYKSTNNEMVEISEYLAERTNPIRVNPNDEEGIKFFYG